MKSYGLSDLPGSPGEGQSESSPLEQVLQQVRSGDPDACGALYSLTNKGVRLILRRHLGHDDVEAISFSISEQLKDSHYAGMNREMYERTALETMLDSRSRTYDRKDVGFVDMRQTAVRVTANHRSLEDVFTDSFSVFHGTAA